MEGNTTKEGLLPIGSTLSNGKYKIEHYLSSGGFGNTYVATDTAFDENVAIKELYIKGVCGRMADSLEISISLTENQRTFAAQQEKFKKEAKRLRKLTNPHIVRVHDLFDENGTSYYVMDLVEGESLSQRLKRTHKPLTEQELMLILPQVLDALETVHAEGIWHLDLKPANIMLDRKGNAMLIDFGASKQLRNKDGNSLSTSSALAYTQGYAPSEQMEQNIEKFGPWTDLYALGATMFNVLTLQQPPSPSDIDEDAVKALPMPASISKKTHDLILWMMKPNRKMRPQCVADVKQFLIEVPGSSSHHEKQKPVESDGDDTVMRKGTGKEKAAGEKVNTSSNTSDKNVSEKNHKKRNAILIASTVIIVLGVMKCTRAILNNPTPSSNKVETVVDSVEVDSVEYVVEDVESVENKKITVTSGPENLRTYTYTGEVENDLPEGYGEAEFPAYKTIPAATYEGYFKQGLCNGQGVLTFSNGDKYEGTFTDGFYENGSYTFADGTYFKGRFKEGNPWNGSWYNKNGQKDGDVKNGKDV